MKPAFSGLIRSCVREGIARVRKHGHKDLKFDVLAADERRQSVSTVINHNRLSRQPLAASAFLEFCLFVEFFPFSIPELA